jgi:hypothetical protein
MGRVDASQHGFSINYEGALEISGYIGDVDGAAGLGHEPLVIPQPQLAPQEGMRIALAPIADDHGLEPLQIFQCKGFKTGKLFRIAGPG